MRIAMIQMPVTKDKEANLKYACEKVREAAQRGAELAVLPEMFQCPYTAEYFKRFAEEEGEHSWKTMSACAAENRIGLVAGSMPEACCGKIYNTAYVFDETGKQIGKHRKMHLFDIDIKGGQYFKESDTFTPGDDVTTFAFKGITFGLCICFDFRFPELSRLMMLKGAQVTIVPAAFNMTTGPLHWETMFRQRAVDEQIFTVGVAPARDVDGVYVSYGNSIACDPMGRILVRAEEKPCMLYVDLDMAEVGNTRQQLPLVIGRRTDLYMTKEVEKNS